MGNIIINGRFTFQRVTGVQRYANEVTRILDMRVHVIQPSENSMIGRSHLWEQFILPRLIKPDDLLWSPTNTGPIILANQVLTLHDISPLDHPEWFNFLFANWYRMLLPLLTRNVKYIITDSQFSKLRISIKLNVKKEKITVVYPGVGTIFHPVTEENLENIKFKYFLKKPYMLSVGSLEPRKNLPRLIQAWEIFSKLHQDIELIVVGGKGFPFKDTGLRKVSNTIKILGSVADQDLSALYTGAIAMVYPSVYEGFGLPVLEAMACGTPVLASSATSLPEVVGGAGILFDPYQVEEIAAAIERILTDTQLRDDLRQKGLQRARLFTWEKTAEGVWNVLQKVLEEIQS